MARFEVHVYSVDTGGVPVDAVSSTGDDTIWVRREPGGAFHSQRIELNSEPPRPGPAKLLDAAQASRLLQAAAKLPAPRTFDSAVCDGPRFELIVSTPRGIQRYFWGPSRDPGLTPIVELVALLEEFAPER